MYIRSRKNSKTGFKRIFLHLFLGKHFFSYFNVYDNKEEQKNDTSLIYVYVKYVLFLFFF